MRLKKTITVLLCAVLLLSALPATAALAEENYATRGEVTAMLLTAADDYRPDVQKTDIIKGYEDGQLHEENPVTRAEALIMLNRAFGGFPELKGHNLRVAIPKEELTDIPDWAKDELAPVFDAGLVAGTAPGVFSPDEYVTTEQMELFISRVFALYGTNVKDSYYAAVNKNLLDTLEISTGKTMAGTFYGVRETTDAQVLALIEKAAASTQEKGSPQKKIKTLYDNITNVEARNVLGYSPIADDLAAIEQIQSIKELTDVLVLDGSSTALDLVAKFDLTIDQADSNSYLPVLVPAVPRMARQAYTGEAEGQKQAFLNYSTTLLMLCGQTEEQAKKNAEDYFAFEKQISDASLPIAEQYDIEKTYNLYTMEELEKVFSTVDLKKSFAQTGMEGGNKILVQDVGNLEQVAALLTDDNLAAVKNYLKCTLIGKCASLLSEDFRQAKITFDQEVLGIDGAVTLKQEAASKVSETLPDYIGEVYAQEYCSDEIIADVIGIIQDVMDVYRRRIQNLTWMSDATKEKALLKLDTMVVNVGAPDYDKVKSPLDTADLKSIEEGGSYFQNMMEIAKANQAENARLSRESVDKTQWITTPQTVNAFYFPSFNSINFPAAFMQAPLYNINGSYEEKMGVLGFVIAHEMTHAFDSAGSQYDEKGNTANWWTAEDKAAFEGLCEQVIAFFDGLESAPGIVTDGELTLTENIADLGAMACVVEIGENIQGFDFKKLFEGYALLWASTGSRESLQNRAFTDVHSPNNVRVDRVLQSSDKFFEVYGIDENDGMYVPKEGRVRIW